MSFTSCDNPACSEFRWLHHAAENVAKRLYAMKCQHCGDTSSSRPDFDPNVMFCADCDVLLCDHCWSQYAPHTDERTPDNLPRHQKTDYKVYIKYAGILYPDFGPGELEELQIRDVDSTWFGTCSSAAYLAYLIRTSLIPHEGVRIDINGQPKLIDNDIYSLLMSNSNLAAHQTYPQLVSFIGEASKSGGIIPVLRV